jgi:hypothetical protein
MARFLPSTGGRRPRKRYSSAPLLSSPIITPELQDIYIAGLINLVLTGGEYDETISPNPAKGEANWSDLKAIMAHWECLSLLSKQISSQLTTAERLRVSLGLIQSAQNLYTRLEHSGINFDSTTGPRQLSEWRTAIQEFRSIARVKKRALSMKKTSSRFSFSEAEMADAFQRLLSSQNGLPGIGFFDEIYREIDCRRGRPDFIALRKKDSDIETISFTHIGFVGASLLSLLKPHAPRTLRYLLKETGYSSASIKKSLGFLKKSGHIEQTTTGAYTLGNSTAFLKTELWAFELKLKDGKRALFQAQQCKAFAEITIIVVPPGQARNYERFSQSMGRWGIGLASFDPYRSDFILLKRPRKTKPLSGEHRMYALSQMFASHNSYRKRVKASTL